MEELVMVTCTQCGAPYRVKPAVIGQTAKCSRCHNAFVLEKVDYHDDKEIMDWLGDGLEEGEGSMEDAMKALSGEGDKVRSAARSQRTGMGGIPGRE